MRDAAPAAARTVCTQTRVAVSLRGVRVYCLPAGSIHQQLFTSN